MPPESKFTPQTALLRDFVRRFCFRIFSQFAADLARRREIKQKAGPFGAAALQGHAALRRIARKPELTRPTIPRASLFNRTDKIAQVADTG